MVTISPGQGTAHAQIQKTLCHTREPINVGQGTIRKTEGLRDGVCWRKRWGPNLEGS